MSKCCGNSCSIGADRSMCIDAIGFDFDDTLFVSEDDKANIIAGIFKKCCNVKSGVGKEYKRLIGNGILIDKKIKHIFRKFVHKNPAKAELDLIYNAYIYNYEKSLMLCKLMQCSNIIKELRKQTKVLFIVTLNQAKDIVPSLKHCGLRKYFDVVLGGPKTKVQNFKHIIKKYKLNANHVVFIGDSNGDLKSAKKAKIHFIGLTKSNARRQLMKKLGAHFTFSSLCDIPPELLLQEPRYESLFKKQKKDSYRR